MSQRPCSFHNSPRGCKNGVNCRFSHTTGPVIPSSPGTSARSSVGRNVRAQPPPSNAPPGICNFFWSSGRCNREFACRFRHELRDQGLAASSSTTSRLPSNIDDIAPFLTEAGLAKLNSAGSDIFFSSPTNTMSPNQVHNSLKRFLFDDFRFRKTFEVYAFLTPLNSANSSNLSWVSPDFASSDCF